MPPRGSPPSTKEALQGIAEFRGLADDTLDALADATSLRHFRRDMFIFGEGEPAESFCFVHSGAVKVFTSTAEGQEQTLHLLRGGDLFAVTGFVVPGVYPGTAQTLADSWIGLVRNALLRALAQRDVALAFALLEHFGRRLTGTSRHVLDLGTRDAAGKLAASLLDLAGDAAAESVPVELRLTHRELAQLIGASRETVTRLLGGFRETGAVTIGEDGRLTLHPHVLSRYLD